MAEVLMREASSRHNDAIEATSSGTWAIDGEPATDGAIVAMRARGIDLTLHRSRPFTAEEGRGADLIIAMTSVHLREIEAALPGSSSKTRLIKELSELRAEGPAPATGPARLAALLDAPRPPWVRRLDLDDPMGLPFYAYERAAAELEAGIDSLLRHLT
ncbi:MAG: ribose 5-phosphate isomerase, partial [Actinomycetota bacterium]|jgi:protein-tyrosine-phosphatase|nr:ribose 5-phosphate isomerase [Actinomycetota bacterium]